MLVLALLLGAVAFMATAGLTALVPAGGWYRHWLGIAVIAAAATVAAGFASAAPTGVAGVDLVMRCAFVAAVTLLGGRARRRAVLASAVLVAAASTHSPLQALAFMAVGIALATQLVGKRYPLITALASALVAVTALDLRWPSLSLGPSLAAAIAVAPILISGRARLRTRWRRRVSRAAGAVAVVGGACAAAGIFTLLAARSDATTGTKDARLAIDALRRGDRAAAADHLQAAGRTLTEAKRSLDASWATPSRAVPVVGQQLEALRTMVDTAKRLSATGSHLLIAIKPSQLRIENGVVPVDQLGQLHGDLALAEAELTAAGNRLRGLNSPWLLPPVHDRLLELDQRVGVAGRDARTVKALSEILPPMLGSDGARRYFLAIETPSEARASGGLIGNFAEISATAGKVSLDRTGRDTDLDTGGNNAAKHLDAPPDYTDRYARFSPELTWANVTMSPDFPTVAGVIESLYPQSGGRPVDGVISIDPAGLAAMLKVVGPVKVADWPEAISAQNAERVLLFDQYVRFTTADRIDFLQSVTAAVWQRLSTARMDLSKVGAALGSAVRDKHIQIASSRASEEQALARFGVAGAVPAGTGDYLGVVTQNAVGNKIDWFMRRSIEYHATANPTTGEVNAAVDVTLHNTAPNCCLPAYIIGSPAQPPLLPNGTNRTYFSLYTPLNARSATLGDGRLLYESERELGRNVYSAFVDIPPGATVQVHFDLHGFLASGIGGKYVLDVLHQPGVTPDDLTVGVGVTKGWSFEADGKRYVRYNKRLQQASDLRINYALRKDRG